jgi:hypothetical protein
MGATEASSRTSDEGDLARKSTHAGSFPRAVQRATLPVYFTRFIGLDRGNA